MVELLQRMRYYIVEKCEDYLIKIKEEDRQKNNYKILAKLYPNGITVLDVANLATVNGNLDILNKCMNSGTKPTEVAVDILVENTNFEALLVRDGQLDVLDRCINEGIIPKAHEFDRHIIYSLKTKHRNKKEE